MKNVLLMCASIGIFGFFGALARYGVSRLFARLSPLFPIGTLVINLTGAFFLGWFLTWAQARTGVSNELRLGIAVGFVGAYTTFSTYMYESDRLLSDGEGMRAIFYILGSVMLGLLAVRLGIILGQRMS